MRHEKCPLDAHSLVARTCSVDEAVLAKSLGIEVAEQRDERALS